MNRKQNEIFDIVYQLVHDARGRWTSHEEEADGITNAVSELMSIMDEDKFKQTSDKWYEELYIRPSKHLMIIYDPDGWDRTNYQYSYFEEEITRDEFERRVSESTCLWEPIKVKE
jgi:hypothetical protein